MSTPLIEVGTYVGTRANGVEGDTHRVATAFVPDIVVVMPGNAQPVCWRNDTCWHGKAQFFNGQSSAVQIGPYVGNVQEPFRGAGFSVTGAANPDSTTCYYIAVKDNGSGLMKSTSYVGNELAGRLIAFVDSQPDAAWVKRDGGNFGGDVRPAIFVSGAGSDNVWGDEEEGTANRVTLQPTGIEVTADAQVNENDGNALGEGHEVVAFYEGAQFAVVEYTGDGLASQAISLGVSAAACLVLDAVNDADPDTQPHAFVTEDMPADTSKPLNGALDTGGKISGLSGSTLTVGGDYNVSGRAYRVWCWVESAGTEIVEHPRQPASPKSVELDLGSGRIELATNSVGNGASTYALYVRPRLPEDPAFSGFIPLIMGGGGADGTPPTGHADEYNLGAYLSAYVDPDTNDWRGFVLRLIQGDYLTVQRTSANINTYNANTGVIIVPGEDVRITVKHDGSGRFRVYINGKLAKEYSIAGAQAASYGARSVGGTGTPKPTIIGAVSDGGGSPVYSDEASLVVHHAAVWESDELTDDEVASWDGYMFRRTSYTGPAPDIEFDPVDGTVPAGATITSGQFIDRINATDLSEFLATKTLTKSDINGTGFTATGAIPTAGRYVVGVITVGQSTIREVTTLTVAGVAQTLGSVRVGADESGAVDGRFFRTDWFVVDPADPGDVAVTFDGQTIFAGVGVWRVDDDTAIAGVTVLGTQANSNTVVADIASGLPESALLCVLGAFTAASSMDDAPEFQGGPFPVMFEAVGSTSRVYAGEGRTSADAATVRAENPGGGGDHGLGILAITQDPVQTMELLAAASGGIVPVSYPPIELTG